MSFGWLWFCCSFEHFKNLGGNFCIYLNFFKIKLISIMVDYSVKKFLLKLQS